MFKKDETQYCKNCYELREQLDQLKAKNRSLKKQLQFEFDETLLQYSNTIEDLQKQLNNTVMQKCPQCGEVYLNPVGCELHEENQQLKAENEKLAIALKFRDSNIDAKNKEILKKCKNNRELIDKNWKLIKTLAEIKEFVKNEMIPNDDTYIILQKISEVEND